MIAGLTPAEFWDLDPQEVVWIITGYQKRLEQWDKLLAFNTINQVAPPLKGSKKSKRPDAPKFLLFKPHTTGKEAALPLGDDDPNKVIVLEERKKTMQNLKDEFPVKPM
jgi:hypothetical protein